MLHNTLYKLKESQKTCLFNLLVLQVFHWKLRNPQLEGRKHAEGKKILTTPVSQPLQVHLSPVSPKSLILDGVFMP